MTTDADSALADFAAGYSLGFQTGVEVGAARGAADEAAAWQSVLAGCTESWRQPRRDELERRREVDHQPCAAKCRRCSRCVHSLSYWARGGRDFLGIEREAALARGEVA